MRAFAFVFAFFCAFVSSALAEERITSFVSDVTVNADASLTVRETITVQAEGYEIKRGILRDFPTVYRDRMGQRVVVGFEVLDVERDGRDEPFAIESISNGKRIRIGEKDVLLDFGQHSYQITYRTTRQLGFFEDFDELYWNVTGNGWTFAIDQARVIIRLPQGASIQQSSIYTGTQGASGQDARVLNASGNQFVAETTGRLAPYEGFTVAVAWQKGLVTPPSDSEEFGWWLADNAGIFALVLSLLLSGGYYYYAWNRVGRDPEKGTIIPLFRPPEGLGPAGARFIREHGLDDRGFAAALVSLAVKGRMKIIDDDKVFAITKLPGAEKPGNPLTKAERSLLAALPSGTTTLKQTNHAVVRAARNALQAALKAEYEGTVFLRNLPWFWKGLAISVAGLLLAALLLPDGEGFAGLFVVGFGAIWWSVILGVAYSSLKNMRNARGILSKISSIAGLLFMIPFVFGGIAVPGVAFFAEGSRSLTLLVGTAVLLGMMNFAFFHLLRAPTVPGRKLLDQLEGFRMYLATAEEDRLNVLHPPEKRRSCSSVTCPTRWRSTARTSGMPSSRRCWRQQERRVLRPRPGIPAATGIQDAPAASPTAWGQACPPASRLLRRLPAAAPAPAGEAHPAAAAEVAAGRGGDGMRLKGCKNPSHQHHRR